MKIINIDLSNKIIDGKKLNVKKFINKGSYGIVHKCSLDDINYVIKFSNNEIPKLLLEHYNKLKFFLKDYLIDYYYCGNLENNDWKYFSIMEYGGQNIKNNYNQNIINELFDIVKCIQQNKLLITDFKLSNLVYKDKLKIIDIYMFFKSCNPYVNCKIVKTFPIYEITIDKLHENSDYNYTYIYALLVFNLIDLICFYSINKIYKKLSIKYDIGITIKKFILLIQISASKKIYNNIDYININYKDFYNDFLNLIIIKDDIDIDRDVFINFLNNAIIPLPKKRKLFFI